MNDKHPGKRAPSSDLFRVVRDIVERRPLREDCAAEAFVAASNTDAPVMYSNRHERLGIDFSVHGLSLPEAAALDPRMVRIAPGRSNERHRHAHESLFVVIKGEAEVCIGTEWVPCAEGQIAFVPRWVFHQTRNTSDSVELVMLAITDFGLTRSVLGDYGRRTRLADGGADAEPSGTAGPEARRGPKAGAPPPRN